MELRKKEETTERAEIWVYTIYYLFPGEYYKNFYD